MRNSWNIAKEKLRSSEKKPRMPEEAIKIPMTEVGKNDHKKEGSDFCGRSLMEQWHITGAM